MLLSEVSEAPAALESAPVHTRWGGDAALVLAFCCYRFRRLLMLCVATTLCAQLAPSSPPHSPYSSPSVPLQSCDSIGHDHSGENSSRPRFRAPTEIEAYYKQNELGGAARAHGPGRVKTCGLSPIYNDLVIIGHRESICPRGSRRETTLVAPGSCAEPSCYSQIRLAVVK